MLKILLNGVEHELPAVVCVTDLLVANGYAQRPVAVEINREIVPKSTHARHVLRDGDRVEIVQAIGGG